MVSNPRRLSGYGQTLSGYGEGLGYSLNVNHCVTTLVSRTLKIPSIRRVRGHRWVREGSLKRRVFSRVFSLLRSFVFEVLEEAVKGVRAAREETLM